MSALTRFKDFLLFRDLPANRTMEIRAALPSVPEYQRGKALWLDNSPATYIDDGYNRVVVAYRCINVLANALASAPVRAYDDMGAGQLEPIEATESSSVGRLAILVRDPNPYMSQTETIGIIAKIALASGFCVYEKERAPAGNVVALYPLRSDWLKPVPRGSGVFDWEYWVPGYRDPFRLKAADVGVFVAEPSPTLSPLGVAPLAAALREVAIESEMTDFVKLFFQNNAVPSYVAILKDDYQSIDQKDADVIAEKMRQRWGSGRGQGAVGIMPALDRIERMALSFDEMAYPELRALTSTQICTAFGVPPILIGIQAGLDASTYSNYEQARRAFYEDTVTPLWARLDGSLTRALLPDFDVQPTVSLEFDTSEVPALQKDLTAERGQIIELWKTTVVKRKEVREAFGLAALADANGKEDPLGEEFYKPPANPFGALPSGASDEDDEDDERSRLMAGKALVKAFGLPGVRVVVDPAMPNGVIRALGAGGSMAELRQDPDGNRVVRMVRLPPETRAAVAQSARDAYDQLANQGAPALRRFWRKQGERIAAKATRSRDLPDWTTRSASPGPAATWTRAMILTELGFIAKGEPGPVEARDIAQIDWDEEEDLLAEILEAIQQRATRQGWLAAHQMGIPDSAYDIANPYVQTVLDEVATRIGGISTTTQDDVRRVVGDALDEGATMDDLAARLKGLFEETYKSRALAVSRTESMTAYNLGTVAAGKASGVVEYAEIMDNPMHDTDPGSDGETCASRNGLIVPLDRIGRHVDAEHVNGSLAVALIPTELED